MAMYNANQDDGDDADDDGNCDNNDDDDDVDDDDNTTDSVEETLFAPHFGSVLYGCLVQPRHALLEE